jgi:NADH:ubiquinone oxidoreductase subunit E
MQWSLHSDHFQLRVCKPNLETLLVHARSHTVIFDDLRAIQLRHGFLPKAELESLSSRTRTPLYQIHSVASFYPHFHLVPPERSEVRVLG